MGTSQIKCDQEIELPIANRLIAYLKVLKTYVIIVALLSSVSINNPSEFNLIFSAFFFIIPIIPMIMYLQKQNIQKCSLKINCIEIIVNNQKNKIDFSKIGRIKQMISTEVSLLPKLQNIYEVQLLYKYSFGNKLLLKFGANINPTEEHELITELKHRLKMNGNTNCI
jgi:hypothetical protein